VKSESVTPQHLFDKPARYVVPPFQRPTSRKWASNGWQFGMTSDGRKSQEFWINRKFGPICSASSRSYCSQNR
jgi:hypothetical protein